MKLSLIKQIFNVDKYILAISPSKSIIIGFYEVMKCYSETPPLFSCFSSFVNDENSTIFLTLEYLKTVLTYIVVTAHFRNLRSKRIMWVMILVMKLSKISKSLNARKVENEFIFTPFFKPKNQAQFI